MRDIDLSKLTKAEQKKLQDILNDPVKWAHTFLRTFDPTEKKYKPWSARWYQAEMLQDNSLKKVARCGRRTGKTETMVVDSLYRSFKNKNHRTLIITPYENQVRLIFTRLKELMEGSPLLKDQIVRTTFSPFLIEFKNGSMILGFTTGASSGSGAASIRGQKADYLILDEMDYMGKDDFDTVMTIAAERDDIGVFCSSTPTGRREKFYEICTNPKLGFTEHYHPSTHNPNWGPRMEAEFKEQLSEQGYIHEIMAEFGVEQDGVFPKDKVDLAGTHMNYTYEPLTILQKNKLVESGEQLIDISSKDAVPPNPFRTMGIDWDKYSASSSIIILDYNVKEKKYQVIRRIEVPRGEYSYDTAVNMTVELNDIYNPSWIYCDRGSGEYQIERLHIIGDERPHTGLKNKVKGWQFKNTLDIIDPITKMKTKEPMKPFMVNQLSIAFERERIMLSPFDEKLHKQLIDYKVERIGQNGPVYSDKDEHFVDALSLAHLAFVLEFPELAETIKEIKHTTKIGKSQNNIVQSQADRAIRGLSQKMVSPYEKTSNHDGDLPGDRPKYQPVTGKKRIASKRNAWGSRSPRGASHRSSW